MTSSTMTLDEQVTLATDLRYALQHGCLSRNGVKHDDPMREYLYAEVKKRVVKQRVQSRIYCTKVRDKVVA